VPATVDGASDAEGAALDATAFDASSDGSAFDAPSDGSELDGLADAIATAVDGAGSDGALGEASAMTAPGDAAPCVDSCTGFDDLSVALIGMHPADTWITRMRSVLSVPVLSAGDLQIEASASQTPVSNQYQASVYDDPTYSPCPSSGSCSATSARPDATETWFIAGAFGLVGASLLRRRRR